MDKIKDVKALTFDLFGTVLDLGGSLTPYIADYLKSKGSTTSPDRFWEQWRGRQRIEQYQDTIMMIGHSGYLETSRRGLVWVLKLNNISYNDEEVEGLMGAWQNLSPFPEVIDSLHRLHQQFKLIALSNGEPHFLTHLVNNQIQYDFDKNYFRRGDRFIQTTSGYLSPGSQRTRTGSRGMYDGILQLL